MKIGIIAAMEVEAALLKAHLADGKTEEVSGILFTRGKWNKTEVILAVCSEGKVNAALCAEAMILRYAPSAIINTGVAGGLSPTLHVPDVAVATAVAQHDMDMSPLGYQKGDVLIHDKVHSLFEVDKALMMRLFEAAEAEGSHVEAGVIVSGDAFIADPLKKEELKRRYNAVACEMEGGAIGHTCYVNGVPFAVLRAISDTADDGTAYEPARAAAISERILARALESL
ncbi:MAG: 5'-methylthioadenosine/adenosylhomocysteine nucleosidase [Clostridia bacterium]|nr:5'-methylthioadenosine/adenosylhomocysteine nucleosidase [Clostridia bacterium]